MIRRVLAALALLALSTGCALAACGAGSPPAGWVCAAPAGSAGIATYRALANGHLPSSIDASKVGGGSVSTSEYDRLDGITAYGQSIISAADESALKSLINLEAGVDVQAFDSDLLTWAGLTPSADAQSLVTAATFAAMRTLLDLEAGTDFYSVAGADAAFQPLDSDLTAIAGLTTTAAGRSALAAADPNEDRFMMWDDSAAGFVPIALADITSEAAPAAGDYVLIYGAEGDARKVDWADLPGVGGGIDNVSEDTSPTLGGNLEGNAFSLGTAGSQAADLFLEEGGVVNWDNGDCTLTQTGNSAAFGGCTLTGDSVDAGTESGPGVLELATIGEAEAGTDTSRAVTAAGLKAANDGLHTIWIPAGAMITETTSGCVNGTVETGTNQVMYLTKDCDGATQEGVQFLVGMPKSSDEGTLTFQVSWTAASGSGDVLWLFSCLARSNDDAIDTAFGSEVSVTDTLLATGDNHQSPISSAVTPGGTWAQGDDVWCRLQRDADAGGDTLNGVDARILGVRVFYAINAFTDD